MYIAPEYRESASRPNEAEQDRLMALYLARRKAKMKAKIDGTFALAEPYRTVTFDVDGDIVVITWQESRFSQRQAPAPVTMTRADARAEYPRLLDAGMSPA